LDSWRIIKEKDSREVVDNIQIIHVVHTACSQRNADRVILSNDISDKARHIDFENLGIKPKKICLTRI
jgi:hypothetical protein